MQTVVHVYALCTRTLRAEVRIHTARVQTGVYFRNGIRASSCICIYVCVCVCVFPRKCVRITSAAKVSFRRRATTNHQRQSGLYVLINAIPSLSMTNKSRN